MLFGTRQRPDIEGSSVADGDGPAGVELRTGGARAAMETDRWSGQVAEPDGQWLNDECSPMARFVLDEGTNLMLAEGRLSSEDVAGPSARG